MLSFIKSLVGRMWNRKNVLSEFLIIGETSKPCVIVPSLYFAIEKIKSKLHKYDVILSDDASARIPSLVIKQVIDSIRKKLGMSPARIYFIAGGRRDDFNQSDLQKFLRAHVKKGEKILVVTEYIDTGNSIEVFARAIKAELFSFTILSVSIKSDGDYAPIINNYLVFGDRSISGLFYHHNARVAGVCKDSHGSGLHPKRASYFNASSIRETRFAIKGGATEILRLLKSY